MQPRIAIIGLGDLGLRVAAEVAGASQAAVVIAGKLVDGENVARLISACHAREVTFRELDASQQVPVESFLRSERPDVVVHCASLLSPWRVPALGGEAGARLRQAGFAAQLPAQLPLIHTVMQAAKTVGFTGAVVNCSYPDVTNSVLGKLGLAPTVGAGNAGIILRIVRDRLARERLGDAGSPLVRVVAHHAHVTSVVTSQRPDHDTARPLVFVGEEGMVDEEVPYAPGPLPSDRRLNALAAAAAHEVVLGLLSGQKCRTSAPGPQGMAGGYPVVLCDGGVGLDLPPGLDLTTCEEHNRRAAALDGVEEIADDGTVLFTEHVRTCLSSLDPALSEPLTLAEAVRRFDALRRWI